MWMAEGMLNIAVRRSPQMEHKRVLRRFQKLWEANIGGSPPVFAHEIRAGKAHPRKNCLLLDLKYDQVMK